MKQKTLVYYETIDGKHFFEIGPDGRDAKAQSKAAKHELEFITQTIGEHKYYVLEVYQMDYSTQKMKFVGYEPRIEKQSGFTTYLKFAKKYSSVKEAYNDMSETDKIVGFDD